MIKVISLLVKDTLSGQNQAPGITLGLLTNTCQCDIRVGVLVDKVKLSMGQPQTKILCTLAILHSKTAIN